MQPRSEEANEVRSKRSDGRELACIIHDDYGSDESTEIGCRLLVERGQARRFDGNPGRVSKPSREAALPAKLAGSARALLARTTVGTMRLMNCSG